MYYYYINLVTILLYIIIIIIIYKSKYKEKKQFITLITFTLIWQLSIMGLVLFTRLCFDKCEDSLIEPLFVNITKVSFFSSTMVFINIAIFVERFIIKNKFQIIHNKIFQMVSLGILSLITFSNFVVYNVELKNELSYKVLYGKLYYIWLLYIICILIYLIYTYIKKFFYIQNHIELIQYKLITAGLIISVFIGATTNIILPRFLGNFNFTRYGANSSLIFYFFTLYAILKYHLFEIKIIISQILITISVISLVVYIIQSKDYIEFGVSFVVFILFLFVAIKLSKTIKESIKKSKDLERTTKILTRNIESKDIFLRMTSHQLRTPITSLNGLVIMALENWDTKKKMNDAARKDLLLVYLNIQRLGEVVNDVLAVNAINADRFAISIREKVDLADEIKFMIEEKIYFIEYYGVKFYLNIKKGTDFNVMVDLMRIKGVFTNIINNAIFYGKGKIWINLYDLGETIKIEVMDNGIGIEAKDLEKIWKRAYRSKRALYKNPNGSGLGLFISREVVKMHNGSIIAESNGADQGSKFTTILPKTQK